MTTSPTKKKKPEPTDAGPGLEGGIPPAEEERWGTEAAAKAPIDFESLNDPDPLAEPAMGTTAPPRKSAEEEFGVPMKVVGAVKNEPGLKDEFAKPGRDFSTLRVPDSEMSDAFLYSVLQAGDALTQATGMPAGQWDHQALASLAATHFIGWQRNRGL